MEAAMPMETGPRLSRRSVLAMPAIMIFREAEAAATEIGVASDIRGSVVARTVAATRNLRVGSPLILKDSVETAAESFAGLELAGRTSVRLGSHARLLIDQFVADAGGVLELGEGAM